MSRVHPDVPSVDEAMVDSVRRAAAVITAQDGQGVDRSALVALAGVDAPVTVLAGEPVIAVVHPRLPGRGGAFMTLTPREREVASYLAAGMSNEQIATILVVTVGTVKDHVHRILRKTDLPSRAAVAAAWHR
jgi:DNA-binding CsgD family transcriptional regulator